MAKKLWAGRFTKELSEKALAYSSSVAIDSHLFFQDVWLSQAHATMLARQGVIPKGDAKKIIKGLAAIKKDYERGSYKLKTRLEDVHLNIETELGRRIGKDAAGKLHTARSRNDQVVTGVRMHLRERVLEIQESLIAAEKTILSQAKRHANTITPGYTHLQRAQPITLGFWFTGLASTLIRDIERLADCFGRMNRNTLGSCALSGTSFPIDRILTTQLLGFDGIIENSLDASSSRDFILELLSCLAILSSNISRICEDLVLWSGSEFGFVELDDSLSTGSSIMPQKKNPDLLELMRGRTGAVYGNLIQALTVVKGLPSGYSRDLQEDKTLLFESLFIIQSSIVILDEILKTAKWDKLKMRKAAEGEGFLLATELADLLTQTKKMPFRKAHTVVGTLVAALQKKKKNLSDSGEVANLLRKQNISVSQTELEKILTVDGAVASHKSQGGTAPKAVEKNIKNLTKQIKIQTKQIATRKRKIEKAKKKIGKTKK
ncbi:MAG: argininosuccinate lyase [Candidatus Altiarchaeota archaeon]